MNVVLILADQLRNNYLGCYGNQNVKTPNIDEISQEGMVFENCFVTNPICMPSRASIFTGQHTTKPKAHYGAWFYAQGGTDKMTEFHSDSVQRYEQNSECYTTRIPEELHDSMFVGKKSAQYIREKAKDNQPFFYDGLINVPLIVKIPGVVGIRTKEMATPNQYPPRVALV